ncbi:hypothetical protein HKBW3S06_00676 [Candidatus Hakubella thermalkaliphila]|uniref:Uncharacterized protein n=1 Tax=Candidatus Hakubella thermalkaliphila TaxID=2754717 RepID=A0A6V8Q0E4_9ACTN|nr:hypothetical protein [Candidatus Hakubella thermalkaliphila]GFP21449.1 hypothetical protein HKBW3S06_00676 [Candidatus Hakubella thermalkaliphila]GFP30384.1 hypothetical protein HKBW3S34_01305 [Candidatus Hakubella thermalkaliphila]GFP37930.1 hypothetical protein HKBW3S44_01610 [Candidatus Hakubella thermalkaliphila]GFP40226.1 hypothetical protein HKBW3S47_01922 [Candidatus Hakubella thermalkaliphila]
MARVVNNTVLSNFSLVGRLDILRELFGKVYVTHEVREELLRGIEEGYAFLERAEAEIKVGEDAWLELVGFDKPGDSLRAQHSVNRLLAGSPIIA